MAASKAIRTVQFTGSMEQNNDAATIDTHELYVDRELSSQFGKNIRNGNKYRIKGYSFAVRPKDTGGSDDFDLGGNLVGRLHYIPVNSHTTKAWGMGYDIFDKQKRLMGRVGQSTRFDDFEIGHHVDNCDTRTSIIDDNPIAVGFGGSGGGDGHRVGFYGDSHDGNNLTSLVDLYNSRFVPPVGSKTHYGSTIKAPKFGTTFIKPAEGETIWMTAHASSSAGAPALTGQAYMGSTGHADNVMFDGHIPVLTGSLLLKLQWNSRDTAAALEDDLYWSLTLYLDGWSAIPKLTTRRRKKSKSYAKRSWSMTRKGFRGKRKK